jgi:Protein of unknown function (DUF2950)
MSVRTILVASSLAVSLACSSTPPRPQVRVFPTPEDAVKGLIEAVKAKGPEQLTAVFGPDAQALVDAGGPGAGQRARQVFKVAVAEKWHLEDQGADKILVIGNEDWPFPIPIVKDSGGWRFDLAKGREEVLNRQIGRNELAVIKTVRTYVAAQQVYAKHGHDGKPAGLYARTLRSDPGKQNGLYWVAAHGKRPSPLGDLVAQAAAEERGIEKAGSTQLPFYGYYYKILTGQGPATSGGAKDYVVNGELSGGFALVAWPAQYGVTGIMTFLVNQDGVPREKDLGDGTDAAARAMTQYNPDDSWAVVQ